MDTSKVTRLEVIDNTQPQKGRVYTFWHEYDKTDKPNPKVTLSLQDEGRTLKAFVE